MIQKPANEVMYDIVSDLFRAIHGSVSINKLEQLKRVGDTFAKGIKKVADDSTVEIFERLQKRVHGSFIAMEKDIQTLNTKIDLTLSTVDGKLNETLQQVEKRLSEQEAKVAAVKKIAEDIREDLKKLDKMIKGIGV
jgi:DNA-binding transcriptional regulator GbsR (MarR family)